MTELSDAHKLIRDTARRVAREVVAPRAAELDESGVYPEDIFAAYRGVGLLGLSVPQEYGGSGAGVSAPPPPSPPSRSTSAGRRSRSGSGCPGPPPARSAAPSASPSPTPAPTSPPSN